MNLSRLSYEQETFLQKDLGAYLLKVPGVEAHASISELGTVYRQTNLNCIFVTSESGALLALLDDNALSWLSDPRAKDLKTAGDFVAFLKEHRAVSSVAVSSNAQIWDVLTIMKGSNSEGRVLSLVPVVDATSKVPLGIISRAYLASVGEYV